MEYFPETGFVFYGGTGRMKNGRLRIWGLTRANEWLIVTVEFNSEPGYKDRGRERAVKIDLGEVDLPTLLAEAQVSPREVWQELGAQIKRTYRAREELAARLRALAQMVEIEELALSVSQETR
ncbi:hypothetical protein HY375_00850 [Candidatus Berkelbacteria bacterium]|nr:hypothetical protein [Candidatus Berkelbacteria bacterium]